MAEIIELERITITLAPKLSKLVRQGMERRAREGRRQQTVEEIAEEAITFCCEAMASKQA